MYTFVVQLAQQIQNPAVSAAPLRIGSGGLGYLVGRIYQTALLVAGLAFFVYLLVGGLRWITAGGDKTAIESARNTLLNAFIGLVIVVAAYAVTLIVQTVLGIKIL